MNNFVDFLWWASFRPLFFPALVLLLLSLPSCIRMQDPNGRPVLKLYDGDERLKGGYLPFVHVSTPMGPVEWVTVRVDSLNVGNDNGGHPITMVDGASGTCYGPDCHEWVYSPKSFLTEASLTPLPAGEHWTERGRERICRICLRHEWQAQKAVLPKPPLSPFDSLRAKLRTSP